MGSVGNSFPLGHSHSVSIPCCEPPQCLGNGEGRDGGNESQCSQPTGEATWRQVAEVSPLEPGQRGRRLEGLECFGSPLI